MPQYDNTNSGILYRNREKAKEGANPKWPDYKGSLNVGGTDYWLSAWLKTGGDGTKMAGQKFFSLSIQPKEQKQATPRDKTMQAVIDISDDIPF